ncbi:MAG TPA: phosphoribosylamine--glycine ligase [Gaiellaceae bacterium]|jgi:phosphoribosylamine---glycine ligase
MKVLIVGSGGREHALAWRLAQSPKLRELHAAPGNPGIAALGNCHPVRADDGEGLLTLAHSLEIDLVVVGPEVPLVAGVADQLRHAGVAVFGPGREAAMLEGSKSFAKELMLAAGVPTAKELSEPVAPCVIKADGLAAGKGVFVCPDAVSLARALKEVEAFPGKPIFEELLVGEELSMLVLAAGEETLALAPAQDFKRAFDGDQGPNTGGMGSYSPVPGIRPEEVEAILEQVHRPVLAELNGRGHPFIGILYAGLMRTDAGIKVLEFNVRFGDPETQAILPRLEGDLLEALSTVAGGTLEDVELGVSEQACVTVVLAAGDYPAGSDKGSPITGIADAEATGAVVFQAGTAMRDETLVTNGGRVLNVSALGPTIAAARERAYAACEKISWQGMRYRSDIALEAAKRGAGENA